MASNSFYEPQLHVPARREEIQQILQDLRFDSSEHEVDALTEKAAGTLQALKVIDSLVDFIPEVKYPRTPGYKPETADNCGNAWAWRCNIIGASSGKLSGKKVAIKDNCAVAGVPMSNGSRLLEGYVPEYDATVVSRILEAGGQILGKASCDDFCLSSYGFSSVDGRIHNPKSPEFRVGGSSGGSAVLVACREVDLAIAADQGGSIRIPAAWTGTVGLKPTHGLVPYTGLVSIDPVVDHVGPITRTVQDCALFLEVLAGKDGLDGRQMFDLEVPEYSKMLDVSVSGKKLGLLKEGFDFSSQETQTNVKNFLSAVDKIGLETIGVSVPMHKNTNELIAGSLATTSLNSMQHGTSCPHVKGFYSSSLEKAVRSGMTSSANLLAPGIKQFSVFGEFIKRRYGNHYPTKVRNLILKLTNEYEEAFKQCDVIVMPTLPFIAPKFMQPKETECNSEQAYLTESITQISNTVAANLTGHPALTLPLGPLGDGQVDSLMIVGQKFHELTVLQVAKALEKRVSARQELN